MMEQELSKQGESGHRPPLPRLVRYSLFFVLASVGLSGPHESLAGDDDQIRDLRIVPAEMTLAPGSQTTLEVVAIYRDDREELLTSDVEFELSDDSVARVDGFVLTALRGGDTRIRAEHLPSGAKEENPASLVVLKITGVEISQSLTILEVGQTAQLRAIATLEGGQTGLDVTEAVDWESRKRSVAKVSNAPGSKGLVSAMGPGDAEISVEDPESGEKSEKNSAVVEVSRSSGEQGPSGDEPEIEELSIEPSEALLIPNETLQLRVIAEFDDGSVRDVTGECIFQSRREKTASVSPTGLLSAGEPGKAKIEIEHVESGESPRRDPEYWVGEVERLTLQPKTPVLTVGETLALQALATYDNGRSADVTQSVSWSSGKRRVVTVGESGAARGRLTALNPGEAVVIARDRDSGAKTNKNDGQVTVVDGNDPQTPPEPIPDDERSLRDIRDLVFEPPVLHLRPGESRTVQVSAIYSDGWIEDVTPEIEFRPRNRRVVEALEGGFISALGGGDSEVRARYREAGRTSKVPLEVQVSRIARLRISPASIGLEPGESVQLRALATYDDGSAEVDITESVEWESGRERIAVVDNAAMKGLVTGIAEGDSEIRVEDALSRARSDRSTGRVEVGYDLDPNSPTGSSSEIVGLAFEPASLTLAVGATSDFSVLGVLEDGTRVPVEYDDLRLRVASRRTAVLEDDGSVLGRHGGSTEINVEHRPTNTAGTLPVTVRQVIRLEIAPAVAAVRVGELIRLRALAEMNDGTRGIDVTDQVEWRTSDRSIVEVDDEDDKGLVEGKEDGSASIQVRHRSSRTISDASTGTVSVLSDLQRIYVEPASLLATLGETYSFTAFGIFSNGSTLDITEQVVWLVSEPGLGTVGPDGRFRMFQPGQLTIRVTDLQTGVSSSLSYGDAEVSTSSLPPPGGPTVVLGLQVSPERDRIQDQAVSVTLAPGESSQLYALYSVEGEDAPYDRSDEVLWFSSNEDSVPVDEGRITCREEGTSMISVALLDGSVTSTGTLGDAEVRCTSADAMSLRVDPEEVDIDYGKSKQLRAFRVYEDGSELEITRKVIWESERPAAVSVIENGELGGRVTAHDDDIVTIIAYDPDFDISSDDSGTNAQVGVRKTRTALKIYPIYPLADADGTHRGRVGELMILKAKVWYESGVTRGVNLLVNWDSSDEEVVLMGDGRLSSSEFKVNQGQMRAEGEVQITASWPADEFSDELEDSIEVEVLP